MAESAIATDSDEPIWEDRPSSERWAPVGAVASPSSSTTTEADRTETFGDASAKEVDLLREENEKIANSLLSLTSHFAQVQFRLKQVVSIPAQQREESLKELEEFAERGIPDIKSCVVPTTSHNLSEDEADQEYQKMLSDSQKMMISELKSQLADLESYAYESGIADDIPTLTKIQKQEVIIEEIRQKLQLANLDNIGTQSTEQLRDIVNDGIAQIVNPAKAKEKVLEQLKTQVVDLERFVDFLQAEVTQSTASTKLSNQAAPVPPGRLEPDYSPFGLRTQGTGSSERSNSPTREDESTAAKIKRIISVLHLFIISELGCARRNHEPRNNMKAKAAEPHYGDLLARMQMSIDNLIYKAEQAKSSCGESTLVDCDYTSEDETYISENKDLTLCVRKDFYVSLRNLVEHGLSMRSQSRALIPFVGGCVSRKSVLIKNAAENMHAWHVVLQYYELKNGREYNESPSRKLADSFGIDSLNGQSVTVKQTLLSAIGHVIDTHTMYKRSDDSHFKAFVSLGLNQKKLVPWLRQIFRTSAIVDKFYEPWSYACKTGFEDVFCTMNKLKMYDFNLPVDLAVKQFSLIRDAF